MFKFILAFLSLLTVSTYAFSAGTIIAVSVLGMTAGAFATMAVAFAINMVVSAVISKAFFSPNQPSGEGAGSSPDVGNRQQVPPATDNKLPVVYGEAWLGGTIVDLSISENNQELYYVLAISEVTGNGADTITFGDVYYGGKKVTFREDG
jgi:membrane protein implicated in regulation of membrane protease activity